MSTNVQTGGQDVQNSHPCSKLLSDFTWIDECLKIFKIYYYMLTPTESNSINLTHFNPSFKHAFNLDFSIKH